MVDGQAIEAGRGGVNPLRRWLWVTYNWQGCQVSVGVSPSARRRFERPGGIPTKPPSKGSLDFSRTWPAAEAPGPGAPPPRPHAATCRGQLIPLARTKQAEAYLWTEDAPSLCDDQVPVRLKAEPESPVREEKGAGEKNCGDPCNKVIEYRP